MLWIKAFHLIAVVCWFSGIFYLPRLFVYHASTKDSEGIERFKIMERKLYRGIMTPAAVIAVLLGVVLLANGWQAYKTQAWMHAKLALVFLVIGYHHGCYVYYKAFQRDENKRSEKFFRWFNEFPVVLLVGIVILVIVKPF
ncbi:MAG: TIGR00701 family protein [Gammaproteobacteria bacterium]|nr:MAG: TIGR00701 family protein [Gammaproteobacteria bacterium]